MNKEDHGSPKRKKNCLEMAGVDPSSEHTFKILINRIAKHLTYGNSKSLAFIYSTKKPSKHDDIPGLEVMEELLFEGSITHQNPDSLSEALTKIDRQDLVSQVKDYKRDYPPKKDNKRSNKGSKSKPSAGGETAKSKKTLQSEKLFSLTLIVLDQTSLNLNHLEKAATERQFNTKEEEDAFAKVKRYGEKLKESLNTLSAILDPHSESQLSHTIEECQSLSLASRNKPLPPPKPSKKRLEQTASPPVNHSSLTSSESSDTVSSTSLSRRGSTTSSSRSGSSCRSEDNEELKQVGVANPQAVASPEQESHTGDSGFNDGTWGETALPMRSRKNAISCRYPKHPVPSSNKEDPDYAEPWLHAQETHSSEHPAKVYTELTAETREEEHIYTRKSHNAQANSPALS